ncbi:hypothetical protein Amet_1108 [Alkaliphilus metalliredigens QYMF]|uniref:Uncharacterized protein n=1 Tax=Alkaliphilus metalliredigens (strain QYMF) TaxID=293826 RepID=A6TMA1_ALKMQ|nr:hypothetical protein [Alkaliphilus metalliredigens]ABR47319.1 hypothetical protein Amet_1108 [Alkaliphilus metalliredigens QYMF]
MIRVAKQGVRRESIEAEGTCRPPVPPQRPCPQLPGTLLRIFIPAGAVINLLNLIEITSPSGICLIVRLPFLGGLLGGKKHTLDSFVSAIETAGGTVEVVEE